MASRRAACEAAGILQDTNIASLQMHDLEKALSLLDSHVDEMPWTMQLKVTHRMLAEQLSKLVAKREKVDEFASHASEFVANLFPVAPVASAFELTDPTLHGFLAKHLDSSRTPLMRTRQRRAVT